MSAQRNALLSLHPGIAPHVNELINGFDSHRVNVKIRDECCSLRTTYPRQDVRPNDRFKIVLPYAGHSLVWEVRFDITCLDHPPDFIFDDQSFLSSLNADELMVKVPALLSWDVRNPRGLLEIVKQLVTLYTQHQFNLVAKTSVKLGEQCEKLIDVPDVKPEQIQILIGGIPQIMNGSSRPPMNTVNMMILGFEGLVPCEGIEAKHKKMTLEVLVRENTFQPKLHYSPVLVDMIGKPELSLYSVFKVEELFVFVRDLCGSMSKLLQEFVSSWLKREEFHHKLVASLSNSDIFTFKHVEFDCEKFSRSSFCLESPNHNVYILTVVTPPRRCVRPEISLRGYPKPASLQLKLDDPWDAAQVLETISDRVCMEEGNFSKSGP